MSLITESQSVTALDKLLLSGLTLKPFAVCAQAIFGRKHFQTLQRTKHISLMAEKCEVSLLNARPIKLVHLEMFRNWHLKQVWNLTNASFERFLKEPFYISIYIIEIPDKRLSGDKIRFLCGIYKVQEVSVSNMQGASSCCIQYARCM